MNRDHRFPIAILSFIVAVPFAWLACGGGESKPAESAASESSASSSSEAPAASEAPAPAESAAAPAAEAPSSTAAATPAAPPPAPTLGSTDCGKCLDTACAKQEAACGKNSDCQSTLDSIHGCSSGAASCISGASAPSAAKAKKLAASFETCAKKATAKACKAKCQ